MQKPTSNYKGMGAGPVGKKLVQAKVPKPTILHAGGRGVGSKAAPAYHPPHAGSGGHHPSVQGMMAHQDAQEKGAITQTIKAAKAGQGLSIAEQQLQLVEETMKRMGLSMDDEPIPMNEGGM